ncbi:MAG TPA: sodium:calcium antiporter [Methylococcus sp.]|nr:sodium:calcium antiporter [Methylococcus sp.]
MDMILSVVSFVIGLGLVIYFAEKLVKGAVGTSLGFGISTFLISVIFIGFDPENLALGAVAAFEGVAGIALGSIIGAAMVAIALAFGITALFAPMEFGQAPKQVLTVPIWAVLLLAVLGFDGQLSRVDGTVLLLGFVLSVLYLLRLSKKGLDIKPTGEVAETLEEPEKLGKWRSFGLLVLSLGAIIAGSELLLAGSESIIASLGLSDTVFGMTVLALLVSIEELARELPAALKGRPEISFGNVVGSILAFFLFNAGIISLVRPVPVSGQVLGFYLPVCLIAVIVVSLFMMRKKIPRWAGAVLVALYAVFFAGGYLI